MNKRKLLALFTALMMLLYALPGPAIGAVKRKPAPAVGKPRKSAMAKGRQYEVKRQELAVAKSATGAGAMSGPVRSLKPGSGKIRAGKEKNRQVKEPRRIIVKFNPTLSVREKTALKNKFALQTVRQVGVIGADILQVPEGADPAAVAKLLRQTGKCLYAEPDVWVKPLGYPDDPLFEQQWGLHNTGQVIEGQAGTKDVDINGPEAWELAVKSNEVVVGVVDTGVDFDHPDLSGAVWTNEAEANGLEGVDDDGNGYVDDIHGWDFYNNDATTFDPVDGDEHGTHVAGIIAAARNNGIGVSGTAPNVKIMSLKFIGPYGGLLSDAILAIDYARAKGVKLLNNSWGFLAEDKGVPPQQALYDAIKNSGALFVAAAGNEGINNDTGWQIDGMAVKAYPASYDLPNILSVAAVDNTGNLAWWSNYGEKSVDVAAPGVDILSTVPRKQAAGAFVYADGGNYRTVFDGVGLQYIDGADQRAEILSREIAMLTDGNPAPNILLVKDDGVAPEETYISQFYEEALTQTGYTYTLREVDHGANGPTAEEMAAYDVVIWFTGEDWSMPDVGYYTLTKTDQNNLAAYLDGGGRLLLSGEDAISGIEWSNLVSNYLHIRWLGEGRQQWELEGIPGTPFEGSYYTFYGTDCGWTSWYHDAVEPVDSAARVILQYPEIPYDDAYEYMSGTSMATPFATGAAALFWGMDTSLDPLAVVQAIKNNVKPLNTLRGLVGTGGMIDARALMLADDDIPGLPLTKRVVNDTLDGWSLEDETYEPTDLDDVFYVAMKKGQTLNLNLTGSEPSADYDLYVFDSRATTVTSSEYMLAYSEKTGTNEKISFTAPADGVYYVDVYAYIGSGPYRLEAGFQGPGLYQDNSPKIAFTGTWTTESKTNHSGGSIKYTNRPGSAVLEAVYGDNIVILAAKGPTQGIARITVDGQSEEVSMYSATWQYQQTVYSKQVDGNALRHDIKVEWTGKADRRARRSNTTINLDAIVVDLLAAPSNLTAQPSAGKAVLKWNPSGCLTLQSYRVYRRAEYEDVFSVVYETPPTTGQPPTTFTDTGVENWIAYEYYVTAVNKSGVESEPSNTVQVVPGNYAGTYEDNNPALYYEGAWSTLTGTSYSGNSMKKTTDPAACVVLEFIGTRVKWTGQKASTMGWAHVEVVQGDTIIVEKDINLNSATTLNKQVLFDSGPLPFGKYEVYIFNCDNPTGKGINIDSLIVQ